MGEWREMIGDEGRGWNGRVQLCGLNERMTVRVRLEIREDRDVRESVEFGLGKTGVVSEGENEGGFVLKEVVNSCIHVILECLGMRERTNKRASERANERNEKVRIEK